MTVALQVYDLWPALRFDEYRGSTAQLAALDAKLGSRETLVITPWLRNPDGRYGVPLRVRFHRAGGAGVPARPRAPRRLGDRPGGAAAGAARGAVRAGPDPAAAA